MIEFKGAMVYRCFAHFFVIFLVLLFGGNARANISGPSMGRTKILPPKLIEVSNISKDNIQVLFSGRTMPGSTVEFAKDYFYLSQKNKILQLPLSETCLSSDVVDVEKKNVQVKQNGEFTFILDIPPGTISIPIRITSSSGEVENKIIRYKISSKKITTFYDRIKIPEYEKPNMGLTVGLGINYLEYSQFAANELKLNFKNFSESAFHVAAYYRYNREWEFQLTYNLAPGTAKSDDAITVTEGNYDWSILTVDALWQRKEFKFKKLKLYDFRFLANYEFMFGVQYQQVPFITRSDSNTISISKNSLNILTGGAKATLWRDEKWLYEVFMRLHLPISSGDKFEISSAFAFDGSIGTYYSLKKNLKLGGFWYGQWQSIEFTGASDSINSNFSGDQSLLFSKIELRLRYDW